MALTPGTRLGPYEIIAATRDGKQFIGVVAAGSSTASGAAAAPQIQVVLNWTEELKQRVPTR